jgi:diamine N-acetyltransferase
MNESFNIFLRPPEESDLHLLFEWENNKEFDEFTSLENSYTIDEIDAFIRSVKNIKENKQFRFMICQKELSQAIGTVDIYDIDFLEQKAGIGILIAKSEHRRKGYALQALELTSLFAKDKIGLTSLFCEIRTNNINSQKLFEKAGFSSKSLRKNAYNIDSVPVDVYFYEKNI